jgi:hypothetical protein
MSPDRPLFPDDLAPPPDVCQKGTRELFGHIQHIEWFPALLPYELGIERSSEIRTAARELVGNIAQFRQGGETWPNAWRRLKYQSKKALTQGDFDRTVAVLDPERAPIWTEVFQQTTQIVEINTKPVMEKWIQDLKGEERERQETAKAIRHLARMAGHNLALACAWETIKDRPGYETNPLLPTVKLYELGSLGFTFLEHDPPQAEVCFICFTSAGNLLAPHRFDLHDPNRESAQPFRPWSWLTKYY